MGSTDILIAVYYPPVSEGRRVKFVSFIVHLKNNNCSFYWIYRLIWKR